jgi:Na+/H+ antiporter NhaD/arsenite permease-like protein
MPVALLILLLTFVAISFRRTMPFAMPIWLVMGTGALASVLFQQITPVHALEAIELDVMLYLFGVFLISQAAESSGYLERLTDRIFSRAKTGTHALFIITLTSRTLLAGMYRLSEIIEDIFSNRFA